MRSYGLPETKGYQLSGHRHKPDYQLVLAIGLLLLTGMIVVYSISPALSYRLLNRYSEQHFLYRQLIHIMLGIGAFIVASKIPLGFWRSMTKWMIYGALTLNLALLVPGLGVNINGATRWLNLGPISTFQPSELLKLALVFLVADALDRLRGDELRNTDKTVKPALILLALVGFIVVVIQRDMGTMLVIATIVVGMLYIGGLYLKQLAQLLGALLVAGILSVVLFPHRVARLLTFLRPESDIQGSGYHVSQSLIAVGSGGIFGLGLGKSLQVYGYLPEAANDSIFAIFAEKFGFLGSVILISIFCYLLLRIFSIASRAPDKYSMLIASGVALWLAAHVLINTGAMLAILPLTGITLPFLSVGGSSLLLFMFGLGVVFQISRYTNYKVGDAPEASLFHKIRA